MDLLKFSKNNSKLASLAKALNLRKTQVVGFDLPAGWTCPAALDCKSKADRITGKITDGEHCKFRCYAASGESRLPGSRAMRWYNFDLLRQAGTSAKMAALILDSIPGQAIVVRIHTSGDFYNKKYFNAWIKVAQARPGITFYGYTKQAQYLEDIVLPGNMRLVISHGGRNDNSARHVARAYVMFGTSACIPVYDDVKSELHVLYNDGDFGLLIHGNQPAGSKAARALSAQKA